MTFGGGRRRLLTWSEQQTISMPDLSREERPLLRIESWRSQETGPRCANTRPLAPGSGHRGRMRGEGYLRLGAYGLGG